MRGRLQGVLKTYVKERKSEIKSKKVEREMKAAEGAVASYLFLDAPRSRTEGVLVELLVEETTVLPVDRRLGTSMSGAFLIWTPFLLALSESASSFLRTLLDRMISAISATTSRGTVRPELDPVREGLYEWLLHILSSQEWHQARQRSKRPRSRSLNAEQKLRDHVLGLCFAAPTFWTLKLVEALLKESSPGQEGWLRILEAAKGDEPMESEGVQGVAPEPGGEEMEVQAVERARSLSLSNEGATVMKMRGPQKKIGLWRPQPIGMIPKGWEHDE